MERLFARRMDSLDEVVSFVETFFAENDLDMVFSVPVCLIIEEVFTNFVRHNADGVHDIALGLDRRGADVVVTLTDFDVQPFDITQVPAVDTQAPLEDRTVGGLGIHFVRTLADELSYEHDGRNSRVTVVKRLEF